MIKYTKKHLSYPSSDGIHTVHACLYRPTCTPKGIVQILHGMCEHIGRYDTLAEALTAAGYVVCGNDHLGHGRTVRGTDELGYFSEKEGLTYVLRDTRRMTKIIRGQYPSLPVFLLGHSMGSMLARLYVVRYKTDDLAGFICLGTIGCGNPAFAGELAAELVSILKGDHYRSRLLTKTAFGGYCSHFPPEEGPKAWVSRDIDIVKRGYDDPLRNFSFTAAGYRDLFRLIHLISTDTWFDSYPVELPTLIASGMEDPVGDYGKGVREVAARLRRHGVKDLSCYLYPDVRHELHNDPDAPLFFNDLLEWMEVVLRT